MKHKYLVVLHVQSAIGAVYAHGNNDGYVTDGHLKHPVLDCTEVVTDSPNYIFATRFSKMAGGSNQSLYLPHGSVVAVHLYAATEANPLGFASS